MVFLYTGNFDIFTDVEFHLVIYWSFYWQIDHGPFLEVIIELITLDISPYTYWLTAFLCIKPCTIKHKGEKKIVDKSLLWRYVNLTKFFFFFFLPCYVAYGVLVPWPGIKPVPSPLGVWSFNHWTAREIPSRYSNLNGRKNLEIKCISFLCHQVLNNTVRTAWLLF